MADRPPPPPGKSLPPAPPGKKLPPVPNKAQTAGSTAAGAAIVYIKSDDKQEVYKEAQVVDVTDGVYSLMLKNGKKLDVKEKEVLQAAQFAVDGVQDMVMLEHLNEASILFNLRTRFFRPDKLIYTYTGAILMSVNPYKRLPIYTPAIRKAYEGQALGAKPPHVYAVAEVAYRAMRTDLVNQSVLISGESGAGKTEAAKIFLDYVAEVACKTDKFKGEGEKHKASAHEQILATNPILEAFGNAKTVRNDNSSRFGKMLDVQFDDRGFLIGASFRQYLLEQTRVVRQNTGERNYHAFYFVCIGADKTEREHWSLHQASDYHYTNQTGIYDLPSQNPKYEYGVLKNSLYIAGFKPPQVFNMMKLLSAILWLGNTSFIADKEGHAQFEDVNVVNWAANLLGVDTEKLKYCMLNRENIIRREVFVVPLTVEEAIVQRDTLAKQLYSKQFEWMVQKINVNTDHKANSSMSLFVLDIFGFEAFEENVFEQFCINYANERLQHEFNEHIFRLEQEQYRAEGIDVSEFTYENNIPTIELIEKRPRGIMYVLDEQAKMPRADEVTCYLKMCEHHKKHKNFVPPRFLKKDPEDKLMFTIRHYAGEVEYDANGFLHSCKQNFNAQVAALIQESKVKQYAELFAGIDINKLKGKGKTVGVEFKSALTELMDDLSKTKPHYIRCVKPNELKSDEHFNNESVLRQLRCSGVLETIRIRQGGFPNQRLHADYLDRFAILNRGAIKQGGDLKKNIVSLNDALGVPKDQYQIGHTKVFLKDQIYHTLEGKRNKLMAENSIRIQAWYRGVYQQRLMKERRKASNFLSDTFRNYLKATDPTEEIQEALNILNGDNEKKILEACQSLETLTLREKNIDIICDMGTMNVLVTVDERFKESKSVLKATTSLLHKLSNNEENATRVARAGGVKQMVSHVRNTKADKQGEHSQVADESLKLIDRLATHQTNIGVVMKEGTVKSLTETLRSDDKEVDAGKTKELVVKALSTVTSNERAARAIGRDDDAIVILVSSMRKKINFGRLCTYTLNNLGNLVRNRHNWSSVVEFGGIEAARDVMEKHVGNPSIINECSRLFTELANNEEYAQRITQSGVLELALNFAKKDPKQCTVPALNIVNKVIDKDPNAVQRLMEGGYIDTLLDILREHDENSDVAQAIIETLSKMAEQNPEAADIMAQRGAPEVLINALRKNAHNAKLARDAMATLKLLAELDDSILDLIRTADIVPILCKAMEANPEDLDLLRIGTEALQLFSIEDDLQNAMDLIGRSRMEAQTLADQLQAEIAIGIVGNLALIPENVAFIVAQGGFPILLSIIGGKMGPAVHDKKAAEVLATAIRAVGRLLINSEENCELFREEGGFKYMCDLFEKNSNSELVMNAVVGLLQDACTTKAGEKLARESGCLKKMVEALKRHPKHKVMADKVVTLLNDYPTDKALTKELVKAGLITGLGNVLKNCGPGDAKLAKKITNFLTKIVTQNPEYAPEITQHCAESFLKLLKEHRDDEQLIQDIFGCMYKLIELDKEAMEKFKELGLEQVLLDLVDQKDLGDNVKQAASQLLNFVVEGADVSSQVDTAQELALKLMDDPNNIMLIKKLGEKLAFLANCAGSEDLYKEFVEAGGLDMLAPFIAALKDAKQCLAHEQALKDASMLALKVCQKDGVQKVLDNGSFSLLVEALLANPAYEALGENVTKIIDFALKNSPELAQKLIDEGAIKALNSVIENHPLNEPLVCMASKCLGEFAKVNTDAVIGEKSIETLMLGISRLIGTENDELLAKSLDSALIIAELAGAKGFMDDKSISDLIAVLKQSRAPTVVAAGSRLVNCLCDDQDFGRKFMDMGGLAQLEVNLEMFEKDPTVLEPTIDILRKLVQVDGSAADFAKCGILPKLLNAMALNTEVEGLQLSALQALAAMTANPDLLKQMMDSNCMDLVMKSLQTFPHSEAIVGAVADLVFQCATPDLSQGLINMGFVDALRVHMDNKAINSKIEAALMRLDPTVDNLLTLLKDEIKNESRVLDLLSDISKKIDLGLDNDFSHISCLDSLGVVIENYGDNDDVMGMVSNVLAGLMGIPGMAGVILENPEFIQKVLTSTANCKNASQTEGNLNFLLDLAKIEGGADMLIKLGAGDMVLKAMQGHPDDMKVQIKGLRILRELAMDEGHAMALIKGGCIKQMKDLLEKDPANAQLAIECLGLLCNLAQYEPTIAALIDLGAGDLVKNIDVAFPKHPVIKKLCGRLDPVLNPKPPTPEPEPEPEPVEAAVETAAPAAPPPKPKPKPAEAPPPPPKFEMKSLEETASQFDFDDMPELEGGDETMARALGVAVDNNADIYSRLQALAQFAKMEMNEEEMNDLSKGDLIRKLVGALNRCTDNPKLLGKLIAALDKLAGNDECFQAIVANGGIAALIKALKANMDHVELLCHGITLIGALARNDQLKTLLGIQGAIQLILKAMDIHQAHPGIQDKGCICLANLSVDNTSNVNAIVDPKQNGVRIIIRAMKVHKAETYVQQSALVLLSNLCHHSNNNRVIICKSGGDQTILRAIRHHAKERTVLMAAFKALGNMSAVKQNIPLLMKRGAAEILLKAIVEAVDEEKCVQIGTSAMLNLVADGKAAQKLIKCDVLKVILTVSKKYSQTEEIQFTLMGTIGHLSNTPSHIPLIINAKTHQVIFGILERLEHSENLVVLCFRVLKSFCRQAELSQKLIKDSMPQQIVSCMLKNSKKPMIVRGGCNTITKCLANEELSRLVARQGVIKGFVQLAEIYANMPPVFVDIMKVFINLCPVETSAAEIAKTASVYILRAMEANNSNQILLNIAGTLLFNMAIHASASRLLTKRGAVKVVYETIKNNMQHQGIVAKFIRVLTNILITDNKAVNVIDEIDVKELVRTCAKTHMSHQQIQKSARAFMRAFRQKMEDRGIDKNLQSKLTRDKLDTHHVNLLTSGTVMRKFHPSKNPRKRRVRTDPTCETLIFEDTKGKHAPIYTKCRDIANIVPGACTHPLRRDPWGNRKADPERCFAIFCRAQGSDEEYSIDLEARNKDEQQLWIQALTAVKRVLRPSKRVSLLYK